MGYRQTEAVARHREGWDYLLEEERKQVQSEDFMRTSALVRNIHDSGRVTVATLGFARGWLEKAPEYKQKVRTALKALESALSKPGESPRIGGVITGGYKGEGDNVYGVTRTGHEVAEVDGYYSIVVTPKAGMADTHENPDSRSIVGHLWGDDSKALVGASDVALVFYRSKTHKESPHQMGRWTEIEIAHLKQQGVPYILVDIDKAPKAIYDVVRNQARKLDQMIPRYQARPDSLKGGDAPRFATPGFASPRSLSQSPDSSSGYSSESSGDEAGDSPNDVFSDENVPSYPRTSVRRERKRSEIEFDHVERQWRRGGSVLKNHH